LDRLDLAMSAKTLALRSTVILTAALVLVCVVGIGYGVVLKRTAAKLVRDVAALTVGKSTYLDAERIADSYSHFRVLSWGGDPTPCVPEKCFFMFDFSNFLISRIRLVRPAVFRATVAVEDDKVTSVDIVFWGGRNGVHGAFVQEAERSSIFKNGPYSFPTPVGKPYLRVFLTPAASPTEKQHAFTIDVHCLATWRSCDLGCDYLPLAWQDWKKELLAGWLDERSFLISYPQSTRCR
jgi:hypothetical protein